MNPLRLQPNTKQSLKQISAPCRFFLRGQYRNMKKKQCEFHHNLQNCVVPNCPKTCVKRHPGICLVFQTSRFCGWKSCSYRHYWLDGHQLCSPPGTNLQAHLTNPPPPATPPGPPTQHTVLFAMVVQCPLRWYQRNQCVTTETEGALSTLNTQSKEIKRMKEHETQMTLEISNLSKICSALKLEMSESKKERNKIRV